MIEEIGIVSSVIGKLAIVKVPKKSACEGCTLGTCKPEDQSMEIEAFNEAGARIGQRVRVAIKSHTYMKGSMLVYGIPALALVIGAVLGKEVLSSFFPDADSDMLSAIFGFSALIFSFIIVRLWINMASKRIETKPVIEEILIK
jgi:sigma-E factor negative regulatory protein RseC